MILPIKKIENYIYEFQKYVKKNLDVANSVSYKRVKYQVQILNIMSYTKMRNLINLVI